MFDAYNHKNFDRLFQNVIAILYRSTTSIHPHHMRSTMIRSLDNREPVLTGYIQPLYDSDRVDFQSNPKPHHQASENSPSGYYQTQSFQVYSPPDHAREFDTTPRISLADSFSMRYNQHTWVELGGSVDRNWSGLPLRSASSDTEHESTCVHQRNDNHMEQKLKDVCQGIVGVVSSTPRSDHEDLVRKIVDWVDSISALGKENRVKSDCAPETDLDLVFAV